MTREEFVQSIKAKGFTQYKRTDVVNYVRENGNCGTQWAFAGLETADIGGWSDWIVQQPRFSDIPYNAIAEELIVACTRLA